MDAIARDETRHAALASSVADFLATKLDPAARRRVERARRRAVASLTRAVMMAPPPFAGDVGLPSPAEARALMATLERLVWGSG